MKGDERILGQGDFVETVLKTAQENLDRKSMIRALGYDLEWLVNRVTGLFGLTFEESATTQQSWGYEDGPCKGPGLSLLVVADFLKFFYSLFYRICWF